MAIEVTLNLPPHVEEKLRARAETLTDEVRTAYTIELFRRGELTHHQLSQTLGLNRFDTDALLKERGLMIELSKEEFTEELQGLRQLVGK